MFSSAVALAALLATTASAAATDCSCKTVNVDVAILGAGAGGAYAAAQLKDVHNKSVVVVDSASKIGGHVDTIQLPDMQQPLEFGVQQYHNLSHVAPFFNRYGIQLTDAPEMPNVTSIPLNYKSGEMINITGYSENATVTAVAKWLKFCDDYKHYVYPKYALPNPLGDAEPLARPFGEIVKELDLGAILMLLSSMHWTNDLLALPTLHAVSTFGYAWLDGTKMVVPKSMNNTELYAVIQQQLGDKVMLEAKITSVRRTDNGASAIVRTKKGGCARINAKKVVVGFAPTQDKMRPFDTTVEERRLFSKWNCTNLHSGVLSVDGLSGGKDLMPVSDDIDRYFVPAQPNVRFINLNTTKYSLMWTVGESNFDEKKTKDFVAGQLKNATKHGAVDIKGEPEYFGFSDHTPTLCSVSQNDMKAGFWKDIASLQGQKSTYFVGQAFGADLSAYVWAQADEVVDQLVKEL